MIDDIGKIIAKRRNEANLTQLQLAEKLGIGIEAVSRMERGVSIPTVIRLAELAEIFGCGIQELVVESSSRPEDQTEQIKNMLVKLNYEDRKIVMETVERLYLRFRRSNL